MKANEHLNSITSQLRELEYLLGVQQNFKLAKKWSLQVKVDSNTYSLKTNPEIISQILTTQIDTIKQELEPYLTEEFLCYITKLK